MVKIGDWVPFFEANSGIIILGKVVDIYTGQDGRKLWEVASQESSALLRDEPKPVQGDFGVAGPTVYDLRETPPLVICAASSPDLAEKIAGMLAVSASMSRDSALKRLAEEAKNSDVEAAHSNADQILCDLLTAIGYADVVEAFENVEKWYA